MEDEDVNLEKYGEFVCSYDKWLPIEEQKKQAKKLEKVTKKKDKK